MILYNIINHAEEIDVWFPTEKKARDAMSEFRLDCDLRGTTILNRVDIGDTDREKVCRCLEGKGFVEDETLLEEFEHADDVEE